jgi:hypothetical protein
MSENNPEIRNTQRESASLPLFEQAHARNSDPITSHKAAATVVNIGPVREKIIHILTNCPRSDEQIAERYFFCVEKFGWPKCSPSGLRSRRSELVSMGFVESCGTGKTLSGRDCQIWRATA